MEKRKARIRDNGRHLGVTDSRDDLMAAFPRGDMAGARRFIELSGREESRAEDAGQAPHVPEDGGDDGADSDPRRTGSTSSSGSRPTPTPR